jgi:hypothetical protein
MRPLTGVAASLLVACASGAPLPVIRDATLPSVIRVCVQAYAPFVQSRVRHQR